MRVRGFLCGGEETVLCAEDDEITASLAGFNVALIAKQFVGVLNCDEAQAVSEDSVRFEGSLLCNGNVPQIMSFLICS